MLILFLVQSERGEGDTGDPDTAASVIASSVTQHVFGVSALPTPVEPFQQMSLERAIYLQ